MGNWNEHHCTTATFSLNPDLLSLTACTLIKASLILFVLFSTTLPAQTGFHKAQAVISVNGILLFLSRNEDISLAAGKSLQGGKEMPKSENMPSQHCCFTSCTLKSGHEDFPCCSGSGKTSIHSPGSCLCCTVSPQSGGL